MESKSNFIRVLWSRIQELLVILKHNRFSLPVVAVGGLECAITGQGRVGAPC